MHIFQIPSHNLHHVFWWGNNIVEDSNHLLKVVLVCLFIKYIFYALFTLTFLVFIPFYIVTGFCLWSDKGIVFSVLITNCQSAIYQRVYLFPLIANAYSIINQISTYACVFCPHYSVLLLHCLPLYHYISFSIDLF